MKTFDDLVEAQHYFGGFRQFQIAMALWMVRGQLTGPAQDVDMDAVCAMWFSQLTMDLIPIFLDRGVI